MWKKITYILICVIVICLVTLFVLSMQIKKRNQDVFNEYIKEANEGNYDNFLKHQVKQYLHIEKIFKNNYEISLYYTDSLILFVRPLGEVKHATDRTDANDQTSLYVEKEEVIYNSKDAANYGDFPISLGLEKMSFYYYQVNINAGTYLFTFKDYDGANILNEEINIITVGEYKVGFTAREINNKLMEDKSYLTPVYVFFGFLTATALGLGLYFFRRWSKIN